MLRPLLWLVLLSGLAVLVMIAAGERARRDWLAGRDQAVGELVGATATPPSPSWSGARRSPVPGSPPGPTPITGPRPPATGLNGPTPTAPVGQPPAGASSDSSPLRPVPSPTVALRPGGLAGSPTPLPTPPPPADPASPPPASATALIPLPVSRPPSPSPGPRMAPTPLPAPYPAPPAVGPIVPAQPTVPPTPPVPRATAPAVSPTPPFPSPTAATGPVASCPPLANTPSFTQFYGVLQLQGRPAPVGTVIEAVTPRNEVAGCFVVTAPGLYGYLRVYGEDTTATPRLPGFREGESVRFRVNGQELAVRAPWSGDRDLHRLDLTVE